MKMIKLGHSWFLPSSVGAIGVSIPPDGLRISANEAVAKPISSGRNHHCVGIRYTNGGTQTIAYFDSVDEAKNYADQCAEKLNEVIA